MATIRHTARASAPADAVWGILADLGAIASWYPALAHSAMTGPTARTVTLQNGARVDEVIVTNDSTLRRQQYRIVGGDVPVESHLGTIDVIDLEPGALVVYSTEIEPNSLADALSAATRDATVALAASATALAHSA